MWVGVHVCGCGWIRERMYAQFCPTLPNSPQLCSRLPRRIRWRMPNSTDKQYSQAIVTIYLSLRTVLLCPSPSLELHFIYPIVYIAFIFFDILAYNALLHGRTFACNALLHIMHVCMVALLHGRTFAYNARLHGRTFAWPGLGGYLLGTLPRRTGSAANSQRVPRRGPFCRTYFFGEGVF